MIRIVLARHGRPAWDFRTPIAGHALAEWLRGEAEAPLAGSPRPSPELEQLSRAAPCLVASPLRRSRDSAQVLAPAAVPLIDPCFREAELPSGFWSGLRLRPQVWAGIARSAWFCGWSDGVESFKAARDRAASAASLLTRHAQGLGAVVLVGHGLMNILIARLLRASGWRGPRLPSPAHWSFGVYERAARKESLIQVRPVTLSDAGAWLRMRCALWPEGSESEHRAEVDQFLAGKLRQPLATLLAFNPSGEAVGFAELSIRSYAEDCVTDHVAYLEGWYVVPEARRQGIGKALVRAAEDWARSQGCTEFASDALIDNHVSAAAHRALGFQETVQIRCFRKVIAP